MRTAHAVSWLGLVVKSSSTAASSTAATAMIAAAAAAAASATATPWSRLHARECIHLEVGGVRRRGERGRVQGGLLP